MTIEEIREVLPSITIRIGKENKYIFRAGFLRGRKEKFATVFYNNEDGTTTSFQSSWESIQRSVNERKPLIV